MTCTSYDECFQNPTSTYRAAWILTQNDLGLGLEGLLTSAAFPSSAIYAKPIHVAYQSTDQHVLAAASATQPTVALSTSPSSLRSLTSATNATSGQGSATSSHSKSGISGGAIAGIAVGAALGGGALIAALVFFLLRFCFGYRRLPTGGTEPQPPQQQTQQLYAQPGGTYQLPSESPRNELPSKPIRSELPSTPVRGELDSLSPAR